LLALKNRYLSNKMELVQYQLFSPERNLYAYHSRLERFSNETYFHIHLPFYGDWLVSQGHEGDITHREEWRHAWDFVVTDEFQKTFRAPGTSLSDFYCYSLPVLAPCAGQVAAILDGIEDNAIGEVNVTENWGNTIIIKHGEYLFSKLSHIKKESFKVKVGDYVRKGDILAVCGNSGRSPEPHIHFQLQSTPFIGAKTLKYPIAYYVSKRKDDYTFHSFDYPAEGEVISRPVPTPLISKAFGMVPGMLMKFRVGENGKSQTIKWEVFTDPSNQLYLYCHKTGSVAYFTNNEVLHYFTSFKGDKNSLLYYFYLGAHKVLLSYFPGMKIADTLPITDFHSGIIKTIQDIVAPFHLFLRSEYVSEFTSTDDSVNPKNIVMHSEVVAKVGTSLKNKISVEFHLSDHKIAKIVITNKTKIICAELIN
jgi:murein DD-endopeptidase MepM/ murein hydrolase activator NlpD